MIDLMHVDGLLIGGYFAALGVLAVLGLHRLYLVALYLKTVRADVSPAELPARWPRVTVQLPVYNERWVVERLLEAVAALDYPADRLEIQVLDDSDDGSERLTARRVEALRERGVDIGHFHRDVRSGYKAGALSAGMGTASGELICVFDADFVPRSGFLRDTVPHFSRADLGMVQVRWGHLNRQYSLLTRLQAIFLDAHFAIEQAARNASGRFFNFNGTAGVWRRRAIEEAGGWQHDTLTEDLDLSYRAQLAGWKFLYVDAPTAPAELPVSISAFKSQQHRWTKGAVQTARKLLARVWRSDQPARVKIEATFHMLANVAYPLMVMLSLLAPLALMARQRVDGGVQGAWFDLAILLCATGSVCVFFVTAQQHVGRSPARACLLLPVLMALGAGIALNNTIAVIAGLNRRPGEFVRTPKYAVVAAGESWGARAAGAGRRGLLWLECAFALWSTAWVAVAVAERAWASLPLLLLFQVGYTYVAFLSIAERRTIHAARLAAAPA
jgi:cellulose synthase/poly-beta-1,6-N-acetylglucosamine synthase-like glycosyltransferase